MKIILTESQYKHIVEQAAVNNTVTRVYEQIITAVSGPGTDMEKLLGAVNSLRSFKELQALSSLFRDKRTSYGSFAEMVNGEFDRDNYDEIQLLRRKLSNLGAETTAEFGSNRFGMKMFIGNFRFLTNAKKTPLTGNCMNYAQVLPQAIKYWRDWLSAPITKQKFKENWGYNPFEDVDSIFKKYLESLKGLKLFYYNGNDKEWAEVKNAYAFVNEQNPYLVHVNCAKNDPEPLDTLVHEIQHLLYFIKPLNPERTIGSLFVTDKTKKDNIKSFFKNLVVDSAIGMMNPLTLAGKKAYDILTDKNVSPQVKVNFREAVRTTGLDAETILWWYQTARKERPDTGYVCRETEKMSNIMALRKYFNLKPGQNIAPAMLKNELTKMNPHTDAFWLLTCWALNGFEDLNKFTNRLNDLAYQKTGNPNDDTQYA